MKLMTKGEETSGALEFLDIGSTTGTSMTDVDDITFLWLLIGWPFLIQCKLIGCTAKLPAHCLFNSCESSNDFLIMLPSPNNLQTDRSILVLLRAIHVVCELVLFVFGDISRIYNILNRVDNCHREHSTRVVEDVPVGCVAPVSRLAMR